MNLYDVFAERPIPLNMLAREGGQFLSCEENYLVPMMAFINLSETSIDIFVGRISRILEDSGVRGAIYMLSILTKYFDSRGIAADYASLLYYPSAIFCIVEANSLAKNTSVYIERAANLIKFNFEWLNNHILTVSSEIEGLMPEFQIGALAMIEFLVRAEEARVQSAK